jgi:uncharacterized lipoprotein YddW (UPF0748 family)
MRVEAFLALAAAALLLSSCAAPGPGPAPGPGAAPDLSNLPRPQFDWRALWVWIGPATSRDEVQRMVALAADTGFNVIIVNTTGGGQATFRSDLLPVPPDRPNDPFGEAVAAGHARGLQVYAWISYLADSATDAYKKEHPECLQVLLPGQEELAARKTRTSPDRADIMPGQWLCPDRGLGDFERKNTEDIVRRYDVDGVAIDFLGYRNYAACYCDFSVRKRAEFAKAHPQFSDAEVLRHFSEDALIEFTRQVRAAVHAARPPAKIAIHVYPDFDPDPLYGSRLAVDTCGQTVAWFYLPHWSYEKIRDRQMAFMAAEGAGQASARHTAFVGAYAGKMLKSPQRLRTEIRLAGLGGCRNFMFAFYDTLTARPDLAQVLKEEISPK